MNRAFQRYDPLFRILRRLLTLGVIMAPPHCLSAAEILCERQHIPLATPITIDGAEAWIRPADLQHGSLELYLSVNSHEDAWTIANGAIYLSNGSAQWDLKTPLFKTGTANIGPMESDRVVRLTFRLSPALDLGQPVRLVISGGIYAWRGDKDRERFSLTLWRGLRARPRVQMDTAGRVCSVDASSSTGDRAVRQRLAGRQPVRAGGHLSDWPPHND